MIYETFTFLQKSEANARTNNTEKMPMMKVKIEDNKKHHHFLSLRHSSSPRGSPPEPPENDGSIRTWLFTAILISNYSANVWDCLLMQKWPSLSSKRSPSSLISNTLITFCSITITVSPSPRLLTTAPPAWCAGACSDRALQDTQDHTQYIHAHMLTCSSAIIWN